MTGPVVATVPLHGARGMKNCSALTRSAPGWPGRRPTGHAQWVQEHRWRRERHIRLEDLGALLDNCLHRLSSGTPGTFVSRGTGQRPSIMGHHAERIHRRRLAPNLPLPSLAPCAPWQSSGHGRKSVTKGPRSLRAAPPPQAADQQGSAGQSKQDRFAGRCRCGRQAEPDRQQVGQDLVKIAVTAVAGWSTRR
jgi:hypothetical protein